MTSPRLILAAGLALAGCAADRPSRPQSPPPPVNAGLNALAPADDLAARIDQDARDLQALLNRPSEPSTPRAPRPRNTEPVAPEPQPQSASSEPAATTPEPTHSEPPAPPTSTPLDTRTPEQRFADTLRDLTDQLRQRINAATSSPWPDALLLAAIAAARPAELPGLREELASSGSWLADRLSPAEYRSLRAAESLLADWTGHNAPDPGNPARAAGLLAAAAESLASARGVRIPVVALCTRVEGFGQYDPLPTLTFSAGRPIRAVLYVEVEGFAHQSHTTPGNWAVELAQEVRLVHDADGSLQWYRPDQRVLDVSRNRRRDFFLVQTIELPQTLSVGNYTLRVTVRDLAPTREGRPPDQAEATLRFAVIADPSATRGR